MNMMNALNVVVEEEVKENAWSLVNVEDLNKIEKTNCSFKKNVVDSLKSCIGKKFNSYLVQDNSGLGTVSSKDIILNFEDKSFKLGTKRILNFNCVKKGEELESDYIHAFTCDEVDSIDSDKVKHVDETVKGITLVIDTVSLYENRDEEDREREEECEEWKFSQEFLCINGVKKVEEKTFPVFRDEENHDDEPYMAHPYRIVRTVNEIIITTDKNVYSFSKDAAYDGFTFIDNEDTTSSRLAIEDMLKFWSVGNKRTVTLKKNLRVITKDIVPVIDLCRTQAKICRKVISL